MLPARARASLGRRLGSRRRRASPAVQVPAVAALIETALMFPSRSPWIRSPRSSRSRMVRRALAVLLCRRRRSGRNSGPTWGFPRRRADFGRGARRHPQVSSLTVLMCAGPRRCWSVVRRCCQQHQWCLPVGGAALQPPHLRVLGCRGRLLGYGHGEVLCRRGASRRRRFLGPSSTELASEQCRWCGSKMR